MSRKYKFASPVRYRSGHEKNGAYFVAVESFLTAILFNYKLQQFF